MSVTHYRTRVLTLADFDGRHYTPNEFLGVLRAWRKGRLQGVRRDCSVCKHNLDFTGANFTVCCGKFYPYQTDDYIVRSVAVSTPKHHFLPSYLHVQALKFKAEFKQDFIVFPDPIYWQLSANLIYERVLRFIGEGFRGRKRRCPELNPDVIPENDPEKDSMKHPEVNPDSKPMKHPEVSPDSNSMKHPEVNPDSNSMKRPEVNPDTEMTSDALMDSDTDELTDELEEGEIRDEEPKITKKEPLHGSFHETDPTLNGALRQLYGQVQTAQLYHCSVAYRMQGKETFYRKAAIAKRAEKTARAMILPAPFLRANEVVLPAKIIEALQVRDKWVIINRMPSLSPSNFVALRVTAQWDTDCIGIPCSIMAPLNADFDGDEINIWPVNSIESQCECEFILNSEHNMASFTRELKLFPCKDMTVAHFMRHRDESLFATLRTTFELHGSESCFAAFDEHRRHYLHAMEEEYCFCVSLSEFHELQQLASDKDFVTFETRLRSRSPKCLETQVRSGAKGTNFHLFQLVGSVDPAANVRSSFLEGLTTEEYLVHTKLGYEALVDSIVSVWKPGYDYFKLCNNIQNMNVDYMGRVKDGQTKVLYEDALEQTYFEDVMSCDTFSHLFRKHFG